MVVDFDSNPRFDFGEKGVKLTDPGIVGSMRLPLNAEMFTQPKPFLSSSSVKCQS